MCSFIAFADVSMSSHFIVDFVLGLSTDRIMIRCQLLLSYTEHYEASVFGNSVFVITVIKTD